MKHLHFGLPFVLVPLLIAACGGGTDDSGDTGGDAGSGGTSKNTAGTSSKAGTSSTAGTGSGVSGSGTTGTSGSSNSGTGGTSNSGTGGGSSAGSGGKASGGGGVMGGGGFMNSADCPATQPAADSMCTPPAGMMGMGGGRPMVAAGSSARTAINSARVALHALVGTAARAAWPRGVVTP